MPVFSRLCYAHMDDSCVLRFCASILYEARVFVRMSEYLWHMCGKFQPLFMRVYAEFLCARLLVCGVTCV